MSFYYFTRSDTLADIEREFILWALEEHKYNRTHTAKALGIGLRTLQRKLKKYGAENLGKGGKQ